MRNAKGGSMALRNLLSVSAGLACGLLGASEARAEMSCAAYIKGTVAEDSYVLRDAAEIAARLIASTWSSPAMLIDAKDIAPTGDLRQRLVLRQLTRDCRALPRQSIDRLVLIHLQAPR
jgi:hypothetical protein